MALRAAALSCLPRAHVALVYGGAAGLVLATLIMPLGALLRRRTRRRTS